jgi:hypothetical protein
MPLLDHFRGRLRDMRHWASFHATWAVAIVRALNRDLLPPGYYAEVQTHIGRIEVDIAAFEAGRALADEPPPENGGGTATATVATKVWAPPEPDFEIPGVFPDVVRVLVYNGEAGPTLVAAVELVSPGNKDRPDTRVAFANKCATYLQEGVGVVAVDIVTERLANLHNELVRVLQLDQKFLLSPETLHAVAYRPLRRPQAEKEKVQVWAAPLALGEPLPVLPLAIDKGLVVRLDLEATYSEARLELRLP